MKEKEKEKGMAQSVLSRAVKKAVFGWGEKGPEKRDVELLRSLVWAVVYSYFYSGGPELGEWL